MDDIARLGYSVDTRGLVSAQRELNRLRGTARSATDQLNNIAIRGRGRGALSRLEREANATGRAFERSSRSVSGFVTNIGGLRNLGIVATIGAISRSFIRTADSFNTFSALLRTACLLYTSPSPRDRTRSRMPSSA